MRWSEFMGGDKEGSYMGGSVESLGTPQSRKTYAIGQMGPTTLRATVFGISEASWNYWFTLRG